MTTLHAPTTNGPRASTARDLWVRLRSLVHRVNTFRVFEYPARSERRDPPTPPGFELRIFDSLDEVPGEIARTVMPGRPFDLMRTRMRRGLARLLVLLDANGAVAAYGWNQSWRPFRRRFAKVATDGLMLGFYWTRPDQRGRGLYPYLIRKSVALAPPAAPLFIYACVENGASMHGIEKAGFTPLAILHLRRLLLGLNFSRVVTDLRPTAAARTAPLPRGTDAAGAGTDRGIGHAAGQAASHRR